MFIPESIITGVRDQLFADWAVPVTFREVQQVYDPEEGEVSETVTDVTLLAVVGPVTNPTTTDTAAQHRSHERAFLIRAGDLPESASFLTSRIIHEDVTYAIAAADHAPLSDVIVFSTRSLP